MIDLFVNWVAVHAAEAAAALAVTGTISLMAWLDAAVKDAGKDAPFWLRFLSKFVSGVGGNVGRAVNNPAAQLKKLQALALVLLVPFTALALGCATRVSFKPPQVDVVWGDAYTLDGKTEVNEAGETVCASDDCLEVRGGNLGDNAATLLGDAVRAGIDFLPGGSDGHTHAVSEPGE